MLAESVVSNIMDSILRKREENSGALSVNRSANCQCNFRDYDPAELTPCW